MKKHVVAITYAPKILPVIDGRCTQTIRKGRRFSAGDHILLHGWEGRPYRSKWGWRLNVIVDEVYNIMIDNMLFAFENNNMGDDGYSWDSYMVNLIATEDYIDPPTGDQLKKVLFGLNGIPTEPQEYQIIRWKILQ